MLDSRAGRINRFTPSGVFVGAAPVRLRAMTFVPLRDRYVVSGPRSTDAGVETLHIVDREGELLRSFGAAAPQQDRGASVQNLVRRLAVASDGTLWAGTMSGGRLEHWTAEGALIQAYSIVNPDLQNEMPLRVDLSEQMPPAQISDVHVDAEDRLWIYLAVPDPDFEPGPTSERRDADLLYDTRVLVLDPDRDRVLAVAQFDTLLRSLGDGWAYDLVDTEIGDRRVRVGRLVPVGF